MKITYHTEDCTRCCGTGQHSYCSAFGTMCFKCNGRGKQVSRVGKKTRQYLHEIMSDNYKNFPNNKKTVFIYKRDKFDEVIALGHKHGFSHENGVDIPLNSFLFKYKGRTVFEMCTKKDNLDDLEQIYRVPSNEEILQAIDYQNKMIERREKRLAKKNQEAN